MLGSINPSSSHHYCRWRKRLYYGNVVRCAMMSCWIFWKVWYTFFFWFGLMMTDDFYIIYSITSQLTMCIYDRHSSSFFFFFFFMGRSALTQAGHGRKQMQTNEKKKKKDIQQHNPFIRSVFFFFFFPFYVYLFGIPNGQNDFFFAVYRMCITISYIHTYIPWHSYIHIHT